MQAPHIGAPHLVFSLLLFELHIEVASGIHTNNYQGDEYNYIKVKLQPSPRETHWQITDLYLDTLYS